MIKKYIMVKNYILEQIELGNYKEDIPLPPERELSVQLGVNRLTLRKAVEELMYAGILIRKKGSGTFLNKVKLSKKELIDIDNSVKGASIKVIGSKLAGSRYGRNALNLEEKVKYWRLTRVRYKDGIPYAYEDIYFNRKFFSELDESFNSLGLFDIARYKSGCSNIYISQQVEALLCLKRTALYLNVKYNSPILQIKSTFTVDEEIIMASRSYHPGDTYSYKSLKFNI